MNAGEVPVPPEFREVGSSLSLLIMDFLLVFVDETPTIPEIQKRFVVRLTCLLWEFYTLLISVIWLVVPFLVHANVPQNAVDTLVSSCIAYTSTFGDVNSALFKRLRVQKICEHQLLLKLFA